MRLHAFLEDVLGSRVKVNVLRMLFKFKAKTFTGRELAESIRLTHTGVRRALRELQASNLVKLEYHGRSNLITLNTGSYAYNALQTLFGVEAEMFKDHFVQELKREIPNGMVSCAVFGSVARGTEKPDSDVDVLFITGNKEAVQKFVEEKQQFFVKRYGNVIAPYIMSKNEFVRKKNTPFVKGVLESYNLIKGEDLWKLIQ
ncbi:nucleotidyltransferase domain-containing protein [Candidatus Woesearchaeota archaeon]|nr:nucleotidyltransferase domain-containing protein [Candidatus Woesearchaeota archaeon]